MTMNAKVEGCTLEVVVGRNYCSFFNKDLAELSSLLSIQKKLPRKSKNFGSPSAGNTDSLYKNQMIGFPLTLYLKVMLIADISLCAFLKIET